MGSTVGTERVGFVAYDERSLILQMLEGERERQTAAAMMELFCESVLSVVRRENCGQEGVGNCGKILEQPCASFIYLQGGPSGCTLYLDGIKLRVQEWL